MAGKAVLAIGIDPALLDFSDHPQLTSEMVRSYIDAELQRLREQGCDVTSCLIDLGETAEQVASAALGSREFDCVVIGAGLRVPPERLLLFEEVLNLVHRRAFARQHLFQHHPRRHRRCRAAVGAAVTSSCALGLQAVSCHGNDATRAFKKQTVPQTGRSHQFVLLHG